MSKIKSFDELSKIRDIHRAKQGLRDADENKTKITIGMATCGIAAGARNTYTAMQDAIVKLGLEDVTITFSGCMGLCYAEPIVEVQTPREQPVLYGHVDEAVGREIVEKHVAGGEFVQNHILQRP